MAYLFFHRLSHFNLLLQMDKYSALAQVILISKIISYVFLDFKAFYILNLTFEHIGNVLVCFQMW